MSSLNKDHCMFEVWDCPWIAGLSFNFLFKLIYQSNITTLLKPVMKACPLNWGTMLGTLKGGPMKGPSVTTWPSNVVPKMDSWMNFWPVSLGKCCLFHIFIKPKNDSIFLVLKVELSSKIFLLVFSKNIYYIKQLVFKLLILKVFIDNFKSDVLL
jgi:hypothetical protein